MEVNWYKKAKDKRNYKNIITGYLDMREYRTLDSKTFDLKNFKLF